MDGAPGRRDEFVLDQFKGHPDILTIGRPAKKGKLRRATRLAPLAVLLREEEKPGLRGAPWPDVRMDR
jgi:hypothetical protein